MSPPSVLGQFLPDDNVSPALTGVIRNPPDMAFRRVLRFCENPALINGKEKSSLAVGITGCGVKLQCSEQRSLPLGRVKCSRGDGCDPDWLSRKPARSTPAGSFFPGTAQMRSATSFLHGQHHSAWTWVRFQQVADDCRGDVIGDICDDNITGCCH